MSHSIIKKRSVIYSWIVSYILIILLPIIATGIVYYITRDIIEDEINNSNNLVVKNVRDTMDSIVNDVERLSIEIASNRNILNVLDITKIDDHSPSYTIYNASNALSNYRLFNSEKNRLYIYFNNIKTVIAPKCAYQEEEFFNLYLSTGKYAREQWMETMKSSHTREYTTMPYRDDSMGEVNMVGFIRSLPINLQGDNAANLVFLLNFNEFLTADDSYGENGTRNVQIIDSNGNILAGKANDVGLTTEDYKKMSDNRGRIEKILNDGGKVIISYTSSQVNDWKYIIATPEMVFWKKAQFIRNIMLGSIIVCLLLGGAMAYFFLKKNYNPLRDIVVYFKERLHTNDKRENNEYGFIRNAFDETWTQKEKIRERLEKQNTVIKSNYMATLLKGTNRTMPVHEFLATYDIVFKYSHFTVMVIYIDNVDEEFWLKDFDGSMDIYNLSAFVITNVVEELLNKNYCAYTAEVDDMLACLININPGKDYIEGIQAVIDEAKGFLEQNYKVKISFAVGNLHETFDGISEAYAQAITAMEYSQVMGINSTVFYSDIASEAGNKYYYPVEKEYQLINCIKAADYKEAACILEEIIQKNTVNNTPSLEIARCLMFDLISTILKAFNEIEKPGDKSYFESLNPIGELMKCRTILEIKNKILQILKDSCDYLSNTGGQTNYKIRDIIINIIENNYRDPNLGINSIADEIGRNGHYISRVFKEQTGESIVGYINKFRIQKAKELLKENKWNQEEISSQVGYVNVRTFQRAYKKQEGTSPGRVKG